MLDRTPMDETQLAALLDDQIADAKSFDAAELQEKRERALEFVEGNVSSALEALHGRSKVVSRDVSDTLGWVLPSVIRIFLSSDKVVVYEPQEPGDEAFAKQATEYINFILMRRCDGYRQLRAALYDGLLHGNGLLMHWWDDSTTFETHSLSGLSPMAFEFLVAQPGVEVLEYSERPDLDAMVAPWQPAVEPDPALAEMPDGPPPADAGGGGPGMGAGVPGGEPPPFPGEGSDGPTPPGLDGPTLPPEDVMPPEMAGLLPQGFDMGAAMAAMPPPPPPMVVDCKLRVPVRKGQLRVECIPPEQFFIESGATVLDETIRFCAYQSFPTRSDLVRWGYDPAVVDDLPSESYGERPSQSPRRGDSYAYQADVTDRSAERVQIWECFPLIDYNGDGIAERLRVVMSDRANPRFGGTRILDVQEWEDELPFTDLVPHPVPHRWQGRSLFDETEDIQVVKTVLQRGILDNTYWSITPRTHGPLSQVNNPDEIFNPTFGGHIDTKTAGVIQAFTTPSIVEQSLGVMAQQDQVREYRTGISAATQGLDPDTLQNQTATAVNAAQAAARSKVEEYARNIKEVGLPRFFKCLLKLAVKYTPKSEYIRLRDRFEEVNPALWSTDMDVSINTGLGTGNRERDAAMMQQVLVLQEKIMGAFGPGNPLVGLDEIANACTAFSEAGGVRMPQLFFREVNPQDVAKMMAAQDQPSDEDKDREADQIEHQQSMAMEAMKAQERAKADQARLRIESTLKLQEYQLRERMQARQLQMEFAAKERQMQAEWAMRERAMAAEFQLKRELALLGAQVQVSKQTAAHAPPTGDLTTEQTQFGGEPG